MPKKRTQNEPKTKPISLQADRFWRRCSNLIRKLPGLHRSDLCSFNFLHANVVCTRENRLKTDLLKLRPMIVEI